MCLRRKRRPGKSIPFFRKWFDSQRKEKKLRKIKDVRNQKIKVKVKNTQAVGLATKSKQNSFRSDGTVIGVFFFFGSVLAWSLLLISRKLIAFCLFVCLLACLEPKRNEVFEIWSTYSTRWSFLTNERKQSEILCFRLFDFWRFILERGIHCLLQSTALPTSLASVSDNRRNRQGGTWRKHFHPVPRWLGGRLTILDSFRRECSSGIESSF